MQLGFIPPNNDSFYWENTLEVFRNFFTVEAVLLKFALTSLNNKDVFVLKTVDVVVVLKFELFEESKLIDVFRFA